MPEISKIIEQFSSINILQLLLYFALTGLCIMVFILSKRILKLNYEKRVLDTKVKKYEYEIGKVRNDYKEQEKLLILKNDEDKERQWIAEGLAKFSDILRHTGDNVEELANVILNQIIKHLKVEIGGFWIKEINEINKITYKLITSIAFDKKNDENRIVDEKEELVGACAFDRQAQYIKNISDDYISISSGLGKSKPKFLLLVPLLYNNQTEGVIEIASFYKIEEFKIKFLEEIGEKIAATIINVQANEKTSKLLQEMERQSQELQSSEEELKQNLEEVQATQEQAIIREEKFKKEIEELKAEIKKFKSQK